MKIAYIVTGQPRFLEEGSYWVKNRLFNTLSYGSTIDYFCHFWDNDDILLEKRIIDTWRPKKFVIDKFENVISNLINIVKEKNINCNIWDLFPHSFRDTYMFYPSQEHISTFSKNFFGQFLSAYLATKMIGRELCNYDIVIKTRSDAIIKKMHDKIWLNSLGNLLKNPHFRDCIFPQWMHGDANGVFMGDLAFIARSDKWYEYTCNMFNNIIDVLTDKKLILYDLSLDQEMVTHYFWQKLGRNPGVKWLSFQVVWPMDYRICVYRPNNHLDINTCDYMDINNWYDKYEAGERA